MWSLGISLVCIQHRKKPCKQTVKLIVTVKTSSDICRDFLSPYALTLLRGRLTVLTGGTFCRGFVSERAGDWQPCWIVTVRSILKLSVFHSRIKKNAMWPLHLNKIGHRQRIQQGLRLYTLWASTYLLNFTHIRPAGAFKRTPSAMQTKRGTQFPSRKIYRSTSFKLTSHIARTIGQCSTLSPCELCRLWTMDNSYLREPHLVPECGS